MGFTRRARAMQSACSRRGVPGWQQRVRREPARRCRWRRRPVRGLTAEPRRRSGPRTRPRAHGRPRCRRVCRQRSRCRRRPWPARRRSPQAAAREAEGFQHGQIAPPAANRCDKRQAEGDGRAGGEAETENGGDGAHRPVIDDLRRALDGKNGDTVILGQRQLDRDLPKTRQSRHIVTAALEPDEDGARTQRCHLGRVRCDVRDEGGRHQCARPHRRVRTPDLNSYRRHGRRADDHQPAGGARRDVHPHHVPDPLVDRPQRRSPQHDLPRCVEGMPRQGGRSHRGAWTLAEQGHQLAVDHRLPTEHHRGPSRHSGVAIEQSGRHRPGNGRDAATPVSS